MGKSNELDLLVKSVIKLKRLYALEDDDIAQAIKAAYELGKLKEKGAKNGVA